MKLIAIFALACSGLIAQAPGLRITANPLTAKTTAAMFGKLPKEYQAAAVGICEQSGAPQTIALARVAQQVRLANGITVLPKDAAFSVIAAAQGGSKGAKVLRASIAAIEIAAIAASWSGLAVGVKAVLTNTATAGASVIPVISTAVPTHTFLTFDHESLPDPLQLPALGCAAGIVITEKSQPGADFTLPSPATH